MFKKLTQLFKGSEDDQNTCDEDPSVIATQEEFMNFVNETSPQTIDEEYLNNVLRNYRYFQKKKLPKIIQQNFLEKLNFIVKMIGGIYTSDNKKSFVELNSNKYMLKFLDVVNQEESESIRNFYVKNVTEPISKEFKEFAAIPVEQFTRDTSNSRALLNLLDEKFNDFEHYKNQKEFAICNLYKTTLEKGIEAPYQFDAIFPDNKATEMLINELKTITSQGTEEILGKITDPVSLLCIDAFVQNLLNIAKNTKMAYLTKYISVCINLKTKQILLESNINPEKILAEKEYEKMLFNIAIPAGLVIDKIIERKISLDLADDSERIAKAIDIYCSRFLSTYDNEKFVETMQKFIDAFENEKWKVILMKAINERSLLIGKEYLQKVTPTLAKVVFAEEGEEIDEKTKNVACCECSSSLASASKFATSSMKNLYSMFIFHGMVIPEALLSLIDTFIGFLRTAYKRLDNLEDVMGDFEEASKVIKRISSSE